MNPESKAYFIGAGIGSLSAMAFGYKVKPNFAVGNENGISIAPKVAWASLPIHPQGMSPGVTK